jgi:hypothetical protein
MGSFSLFSFLFIWLAIGIIPLHQLNCCSRTPCSQASSTDAPRHHRACAPRSSPQSHAHHQHMGSF